MSYIWHTWNTSNLLSWQSFPCCACNCTTAHQNYWYYVLKWKLHDDLVVLVCSDCCSFHQSSADNRSGSPCLMFFYQDFNNSELEAISQILADFICPVLLKTVIKGNFYSNCAKSCRVYDLIAMLAVNVALSFVFATLKWSHWFFWVGACNLYPQLAVCIKCKIKTPPNHLVCTRLKIQLLSLHLISFMCFLFFYLFW